MSSDNDRIVLEDDAEGPATKVGALVAAGAAVIVALVLLGSVGSPVEAPSDALPGITAPAQQPLAIMPDLGGHDLIDVVDRLRDAGLDSTIVSQAQWLANPDVPAGLVSAQSPPPGTEIFDINEVTLIMSAGGPVISWDEVPVDLQELISTQYTPDRSEPVLIVETGSGRAYKTDDLLFGPCNAVELARNTFYDRSFDGLCQVGPPQTIVGWTPNGGLYAIEGLPRQEHKSSSTLLQVEFQFWDIQSFARSVRRAPTVAVEEGGIRVSGGYDDYFLWNPDPVINEEIAALIEPVDIRGSLVLNLSPPMRFAPRGQAFAPRGQAESDFGAASVRFDDADVIVSETGSSATVSPAYVEVARTTVLQPARWATIQSFDREWQHAIPGGWVSAELSEPELVTATTFAVTGPDERCGVYPVGFLKQIGPSDAFVSVSHGESTDFGIWLAHFDLDDVPPVSALDPNLDCLSGLDAEIRSSSRFYDGQPLDIVVGFGLDANEETRQQALAILDSLEPSPVYDRP